MTEQTASAESPVSFEVDGVVIRGVWHRPAGVGPFPAVLWVPGFASPHGDPRAAVKLTARELARAGIASLRFDFRGTGESDGESAETTVRSGVADTRAAMAWLAGRCEVTPAAIAVAAQGLGCAIAPEIFAERPVGAFLCWSPMVFPVPIFARMGLYRAHPELAQQGWIDAGGVKVGKQFVAELSDLDPLSALQHYRHPLLVLCGGEDMWATLENAQAILAELPQAEGLCLPHAEHAFSRVSDREWLITQSVAWLKQHLLAPHT